MVSIPSQLVPTNKIKPVAHVETGCLLASWSCLPSELIVGDDKSRPVLEYLVGKYQPIVAVVGTQSALHREEAPSSNNPPAAPNVAWSVRN